MQHFQSVPLVRMSRLLIILLCVGIATAGFGRRRRDNTYGDEAVTPATGAASAAPVAVEVSFILITWKRTKCFQEAAATVAPEGGGAQSAVESSGYRKKRATQNSYGDEATVPVGGGAPVADVSEAPAVTVEQSGGSQSAVASSGY